MRGAYGFVLYAGPQSAFVSKFPSAYDFLWRRGKQTGRFGGSSPVVEPHAFWPQIEAIYRAELPRFVRVARAITGDGDSALEAVQEGFADALRSSGQWTGAGPLEGWIWRCVLNRARKARPTPTPTMALGERAEPNGRDHEPEGPLRAHLAALPERQRLVVFLRYFADLEYREIAAALGIEIGTVGATLSAAHASLRTALEEVPA